MFLLTNSLWHDAHIVEFFLCGNAKKEDWTRQQHHMQYVLAWLLTFFSPVTLPLYPEVFLLGCVTTRTSC